VHRESDFDQHDFASGCVGPLLDAVAADDMVLARRIAALSPSLWRQGHEYEDDFCYAQILHRLIAETIDEPNTLPWIRRLEALADLGMPARAPLCLALLRADQSAFDSAFEEFLRERAREIDDDEERGSIEAPAVLAQRKISVDALAFLRLAERSGLRTYREYRFCPAMSRQPMRIPIPDD
jgi:hypothetical protein